MDGCTLTLSYSKANMQYFRIEVDEVHLQYVEGASIKYVRTEGEGGRGPKSVRSKRGCVILVA